MKYVDKDLYEQIKKKEKKKEFLKNVYKILINSR